MTIRKWTSVLHLFVITSGAVAMGNQGSPAANGSFDVFIFEKGSWKAAGNIACAAPYSTQSLAIGYLAPGAHRVRLDHRGSTAAHIDAAVLGESAPSAVSGCGPEACRKLSACDYDVLDATGRSIILDFEIRKAARHLVVRARAEHPAEMITPFEYPLENIGKKIDPSSRFISYPVESRRGKLDPDGDLAGELLGDPCFIAQAQSCTGHPSLDTYGWVMNDSDALYAAMDFVPDNTMDGNKDFGRILVKTGAGVKGFRVSVPETQWGRSGFAYTSRAAHQHKVYEFRIPFSDLGISRPEAGQPLEIAFEAYGTYATAASPSSPLIDDFEAPASGQQVLASPSSVNGSCVDGSMYSGERDVRVSETGGESILAAQVNIGSSGQLRFDSVEGGEGTANVVWDGHDNNYTTVGNSPYNLSSYNRIGLLGVSNSGTQPVSLALRLHTVPNHSTSDPIELGAGFGPTFVEFLFADFTPTSGSGFSSNYVSAVELIISNAGYSPGAVLDIGEIRLSDTALPVFCTAFSAETAEDGVMLRWRTASELNCAGFYVYRSDGEDGSFERISGLIPSPGNNSSGGGYRFLDAGANPGNAYRYRLTWLDADTGSEQFVEETLIQVPLSPSNDEARMPFALLDNFPNPFNGSTQVRYVLPESVQGAVEILDASGRHVRTLDQGILAGGVHLIHWDGFDDSGNPQASGIYLCRLVAGKWHETRHMTLVR